MSTTPPIDPANQGTPISSPAEDSSLPPRNDLEKQNYLKAGLPLVFDPPSGAMHPHENGAEERRVVQADWINALVHDGKIDVPVVITNAIIIGRLQLKYVTFDYELSITNSEVKDRVDLSFATFNRAAVFDDTTFGARINFRGAHARGDLRFVKARFPDCQKVKERHDDVFQTDFQDIRVDHLFCADGAWFGCVNFKRADFCKTIFFRPAAVANSGPNNPKAVATCFAGVADFSDATISGPAFFNGANFEHKAEFARAHFASVADFRCYDQDGYLFRTHFRDDTRFVNTRIDRGASFQGAFFHGQVFFDSANVLGSLHFHYFIPRETIKVEHTKRPGMEAANIRPPKGGFTSARFAKKASFFAMQVGASLTFVGARFEGDADFELIHVGGHALFGSFSLNDVIARTAFLKKARFFHAQVDGNLEFIGTKFVGPAIFELVECPLINFMPYWVKPKKKASSSIFRTKVTFIGMRVNGEAHFSGVKFLSEAVFEGVQISGRAYFDDLIHDLEFDTPDYHRCDQVKFEGPANFNNSNFTQDANFMNASFSQKAVFSRATVQGEACFRGATFNSDVSFNNATMTSVLFAKELLDAEPPKDDVIAGSDNNVVPSPKKTNGFFKRIVAIPKKLRQVISKIRQRESSYEPQFEGALDFRGFTYERIEVNLDELLDDKIRPYDRQPYAQLEKSYRAISDDTSVDRIYVKARSCERKRIGKRVGDDIKHLRLWKATRALPYWMVDYFHWGLTRYGTLPIMLLIMSGFFLGTGAIVFSRNGAVKYKDKADELLLASPAKLDGWGALGVSFNQFIPVVDIPSGGNYKPSDKLMLGDHVSYATYGTVHRLAGAVLVPAGIAALALLLYRRGKTEV